MSSIITPVVLLIAFFPCLFDILTGMWIDSCSNYWRDHDTALFIIKHLYRDIPEEPPAERMPVRLFYVRDPIAEDTPLTFSDNSSVKEFSRKVKTYSRKMENDANCETS